MVKPVTRGIVLLWQEFVLVVVMLCCCSWLYCKDCTSHGSPTVQPAGHGQLGRAVRGLQAYNRALHAAMLKSERWRPTPSTMRPTLLLST